MMGMSSAESEGLGWAFHMIDHKVYMNFSCQKQCLMLYLRMIGEMMKEKSLQLG